MNYINKIIMDKTGELFSDVYLPELLIEKEPLNCFYADPLPILVSEINSEKLDQVDIYLKKELQLKMSNVLRKLWLYNDTFLKSELLLDLYNVETDEKTIKQLKKYISKPENKTAIQISNFEQIELLIDFSFKDKIDLMLIFKQFQLIIVASWSCFIVYMSDLTQKDLIEKIINVEGLYLRPYKSENVLKL